MTPLAPACTFAPILSKEAAPWTDLRGGTAATAPLGSSKELYMKDVAVVAYCRTGIAKAQRGALIYNQAQLETPWETTNVNGGAVALGHPYGMSTAAYLKRP